MSHAAHAVHDQGRVPAETQKTTLHVGGVQYASEKAVVERVLGRRPGVISVDANPVAQTATVEYDPAGARETPR
jgi:Cu2+-exporting ATPase